MDAKLELCWFFGYTKGIRGYNFYKKSDMKVFMSTNAKFMGEEYIMNHIIRDMNEWTEKAEFSSIQDNVVPVDPQPLILDTYTPNMPRCSGRVIRPHVKLTWMGESSLIILESHEDDPTTYYEEINDKGFDFWKEAMKSELESMYSNNVWTLMNLPQGVKPIGCKWVYKRKKGVDGKVETYKARQVAKGYSQKSGFNYVETFSPVAMIKSIRILLSIAAYCDYEIWKMDVKTAFLNGYLEENIYMMQPDGFITEGQEHMICKLHKSIYRLKQASRSWNKCFDQVIKSFGFNQNEEEPRVYRKIQDDIVVFLILYVDDILLIGNDFEMFLNVNIQLATRFQMKDLGEARYVLGIKIIRDRKNKIIALSQENYIDRILSKYNIQDSKKGFTPFRYGINLS